MTTVGFGDFYPGTVFGRILILVTAMWGTCLIGLLILSVGEVFNLTPNEGKSLQQLLQTRMAAKAITASMRYFTYKSKYLKSHSSKSKEDQLNQPEDENTIEDRVELNELNRCRKEMLKALADFKQHSRILSDLNDTEE